jgi:hypothetical protein
LTKAKRFDGSSSQPIAVIRSGSGLVADPLGIGPTLFPLLPGTVSAFSGITFCPSFFSPRGVAGSFFSGGFWIFEGSWLVSWPLARAGSWEGGSGITCCFGAEESMDAGGPDFGGELASGGAGLTGCLGAGEVMDAGGTGFGGELTSGGAGSTSCFGAEEVMDAGGLDFDEEPNHATTA